MKCCQMENEEFFTITESVGQLFKLHFNCRFTFQISDMLTERILFFALPHACSSACILLGCEQVNTNKKKKKKHAHILR